LIAVLGLAHVAVAQCPLTAYTGGRSVESRLDALEAQVHTLTTRLDQVERITAQLAMVSSRLVDHAVANNQPSASRMAFHYASNNADDEPISLVADRAVSPALPTALPQSGETGHVELRTFGAANMRLMLQGTGGYIAVGNEAAKAGTSVASGDDLYSSSLTYYRQRAQQKAAMAAIQPANYYRY
jgi:hypothetical protein